MEEDQVAVSEVVTAMTWPDPDRELPSRRVEGVLSRRYVETLSYWQYSVDGIGVDPKTIELKKD